MFEAILVEIAHSELGVCILRILHPFFLIFAILNIAQVAHEGLRPAEPGVDLKAPVPMFLNFWNPRELGPRELFVGLLCPERLRRISV